MSNGWLVVCARPCGPAPIAQSAASAGKHKAAVSMNTNREEKYAPVAPMAAAARPLPIEEYLAFRPSRSPSAA